MQANRQLEKSQKTESHRKKKQYRAFKLSRAIYDRQFLEKFNPILENWINKKIFYFAEKLEIKFQFLNYKLITFFDPFNLVLFNKGVCPPFSKGNQLTLEKKSKLKPRKS